jgi:hypothetical protein
MLTCPVLSPGAGGRRPIAFLVFSLLNLSLKRAQPSYTPLVFPLLNTIAFMLAVCSGKPEALPLITLYYLFA